MHFIRKAIPIVAAVAALYISLLPVGYGQVVPPNVLQELQRQQGVSARPQRRVSPVDQSRENRQADVPLDGDFDFETQQDLAEDDEELEDASVVEMDYRERLDDETLIQFGYDRLLGSRVRGLVETTGRVSDSYILGVGDEVAVVLRGSEEQSYITPVDSEGRLILDGLTPISAAGRSLADVRSEIIGSVSQAFIGTDAYVSLASLAQITVTVVGEAELPGAIQLTSQQTILDALIKAGGIRKTGSLRQIKLIRGERSRNIDLYRLFRGQSALSLNLRDGDRIVVPGLGQTYAVTGEVLRPAIYELPETVSSLTAKTALDVAGGLIRPRGYELVVSRLDDSGSEQVLPIKRSETMIAGDALVVVRASSRAKGKLFISGHVRAPGLRALATAATVGDLVDRSGGYLDAPYLPFAVLEREDPISLNRTFTPVSLLQASLEGRSKPLQQEDRLIVLGADDVAFLSSNAVRQVVLSHRYSGALTCEPLSELANLSQDLQTERFSAVLRGAFILETSDGNAQIADVSGIASEDEEALKNRSVRQITDLELEEMDEEERDMRRQKLCPAVYEDNPGLLAFVLEHVATVSGSVRRPAVLPVAAPTSLANLIQFAGGLSAESSRSNVEISAARRNENSFDLDRGTFDLTETPLETILIDAGTAVTVQSIPSEQEPGTVLLSGEFKRPGVYTIRRGERLSEVIERAGGVTERAYTYGAVFTRVSVRRAQEQAFRRTAREMNTALTTAALKNNVDSDALAAARELSREMQTAETLGRVVVEADPRVLELRKDLDAVMEPGDRLFMPKRPNHILAMGDVLNPGALQFVRGKVVAQYLSETGGIQSSADTGRIFLVYPNGVAKPLPKRFWGSRRELVPPGSTIVVPKDTDPLATLQLTREITSVVSQLALSAASFAVIFD